MVTPPLVTAAELARAHEAAFVEAALAGRVTREQLR
ncbi:hypothetical protein HRbin40_00513 [bacterium HR40]|nr:hypothetical protein HRbin40_00513 [bacterium HR40]